MYRYNQKMPIKSLLFCMLGGAIGTVSRALVVHKLSSITSSFPWGTLFVNLLGCFLIGLLWTLCQKWQVQESLKYFLITGVLGGLTTFSTFGLDAITLFQNQSIQSGSLYVGLSVGLGLVCVKLGLMSVS